MWNNQNNVFTNLLIYQTSPTKFINQDLFLSVPLTALCNISTNHIHSTCNPYYQAILKTYLISYELVRGSPVPIPHPDVHHITVTTPRAADHIAVFQLKVFGRECARVISLPCVHMEGLLLRDKDVFVIAADEAVWGLVVEGNVVHKVSWKWHDRY